MSRVSGHGSATSKKDISRKKRSWTLQEETALIAAFKGIIASGWKAQNGYRSGFLAQLELRLKAALPNTDLRAEPNISSKYTAWKKSYYQIFTALSLSGWNWNSSSNTVEAEPEQWEAFLKQFPNHHVIRGKSFPYYRDWEEIYGKDKATGHHANDFASMNEENTINIDDIVEETEESSYRPSDVPLDDATESHADTPKSKPSKLTGSKKRKIDKNDEILVEAITSFCTNSLTSIKEVASRMGAEIDASRRRESVFEAISLLPMDLNEDDHMHVCYKLVKDKEAMDMFFGLPMGGKMNMVNMIIKGKFK